MAVEAVAVNVGIAFLKTAVGGLLTELVKETTSPVLSRNNNCESLGRMLAQLEPIVESIPTSTSTNAVKGWLEVLRTRLASVKHVLQESSRHSNHLHIKQFSISKKLVKEIKHLSETLSTAPVVVLPLSIAASTDMARLHERCKEISERLEELQNELQRQELARITRKALETPTNYYGNSTDLMTVSKAYSSIKERADFILNLTANNDSSELDGLNRALASDQGGPTHRRLDSETMFGGDAVVDDAKKLLLVAELNCHKVGLWASGGTGKTHAALRVFNDVAVQAHFTGGCFFLTVGRILPLERVLLNLQLEITGRADVRRSYISIEDLKHRLCMEFERKKNMLVVLDDVWEEHVLRSLLDVVPTVKADCKILVTTRNYQVLDKNNVTKLQVPLLSPEHSWELFCWQAFRGVNSRVPSELEELAKNVTRECGGLPLALKVIGRVFVGKTDRGYWKYALEKLRNADILDPDHEKQLYERLKLSVDELPTIHPKLTDCFLYFAAFPESAKVKVYQDLLPLWTGDRIVGNFSSLGNRSYDPKEEACELIGWLVSRSLIELRSETLKSGFKEDFLLCTVHDVLRDLARYMLQHKIAVAQRECLYEAGRDLEFPREWIWIEAGKDHRISSSDGRAPMVTLSARRMSVMSANLKTLPPKLWDAPNLRVLLLRNNPFTSIPNAFFSNLQNIRVLDLSFTSVTSLPKSIGIDLKLLVVLNASHTQLTKLPDSLGSLTSLEHLTLEFCKKLSHLPASVSSLTRLESLSVIDASSEVWKDRGLILSFLKRKCGLEDLLSLVALKQLRINNGSHTSALPAGFLTALKKLQKLELQDFEQLRQFPEPRVPNDLQHLQVLDLTQCSSLTSLPSSFDSLPLLDTLILSSCRGLLSLPALDGLKNLVNLDLTECNGLESLPATFGRKDGFPTLEKLGLYGCDKVASFPELENGAMPCLKFLDLTGWSQLDTLPKSLASLKNLRFLGLTLCFNLKTLEHEHLRFTSFGSLEELVLESCGLIPHLPASLALLPNLRLLKMRGCNATIPEELQREITNGRVMLR